MLLRINNIKLRLRKQKNWKNNLLRKIDKIYLCHKNIDRLPGAKTGNMLRIFLGNRVYDAVFAQHIADHWEEYIEAISEDKHSLAVWIKFRCTIYLCWSAIALIPVSLAKLLFVLWKHSSE